VRWGLDVEVIFIGNRNSDSLEQDDDDDIQIVEIKGGSKSDDEVSYDSDSETETDSGPDLADEDPKEVAAWEQQMAEEIASGQLEPGPGLRAWVRSGRHLGPFFFRPIYEEEGKSSSSDMEDGENEV